MKNRILYLDFDIPYLLAESKRPVGGAAVEWYTWIQAFRKSGCEFGLLTWKGAREFVKKKHDFDFVESFDVNKGIPKIRRFTYRIPSLYRAVKQYNPDFIIQGTITEYTGILAFIAKLLGKPFVHRVASDVGLNKQDRNIFSKFTSLTYEWGIKNASHISCQNKYQYKTLKKKFPNKSISILYNPYFRKNEIDNFSGTKTYIAWVGNFRSVKNLQALAKIALELPQYEFRIAGTKFENTDHETTIGLEKLQALNNVKFVGHISNDSIPEFLSKAYCLLNTSITEGFSNTFLEAWAVGIPVISTKNVNPDNIITDYNVGIVTDNYSQLPKVLDNLITTKKYSEYEPRCKTYVSNNHNPIKLAQIFLQEMKDCIN